MYAVRTVALGFYPLSQIAVAALRDRWTGATNNASVLLCGVLASIAPLEPRSVPAESVMRVIKSGAAIQVAESDF